MQGGPEIDPNLLILRKRRAIKRRPGCAPGGRVAVLRFFAKVLSCSVDVR